jgi:hypothetical protein
VAWTIDIPWIARLVLATDAAECRALAAAEGIDRPPPDHGRLVNRLVAARLRRFRARTGELWPAFAGRHDQCRLTRRTNLANRLGIDGLLKVQPELDRLAAFVAGKVAPDALGPAAQQLVGRLCLDGYVADAASYAAARTVDAWISSGPLRTLYLRRSGRLQAAIDLLEARAHGDLACAHATAIAVHNLVASLEAMCDIAHSQDRPASPDEAVRRALHVPAVVVRGTRDAVTVGKQRVRERSLVLLAVRRARRSSVGFDGFFADGWNACPAHGSVRDLLAEVWRRAQAIGGWQ